MCSRNTNDECKNQNSIPGNNETLNCEYQNLKYGVWENHFPFYYNPKYHLKQHQNIPDKVADSWTPPSIANTLYKCTNVQWTGTLMDHLMDQKNSGTVTRSSFWEQRNKVYGSTINLFHTASLLLQVPKFRFAETCKDLGFEKSLSSMVFNTTSLNTNAQILACSCTQLTS